MIAVICSNEPGITLIENNDYNRDLIRRTIKELDRYNDNYDDTPAYTELQKMLYITPETNFIGSNSLVDVSMVVYLEVPIDTDI